MRAFFSRWNVRSGGFTMTYSSMRAARRSSTELAARILGATLALVSVFSLAVAAPGQLKAIAHLALPAGAPVETASLDVQGRHLYLARGSAIEVVNPDSGAQERSIPLGGKPTLLLLSADARHLFAADRQQGRLFVLRPGSGEVAQTVALRTPSALAYDDELNRLYVADGEHTVTSVDADSARVLGHLTLSDRVGQLAANGYGTLFASSPGTNRVHFIDTTTFKEVGAVTAHEGQDCSGMALDTIRRRIFAACANGRVAIIDTDLGMTTGNTPGPAGASCGEFAFKPFAGWRDAAVFLSDEGGIGLIGVKGKQLIYSQGTAPSHSRAVFLDPKVSRILVIAQHDGASELLALGM
jgi:hypothetical protein